MRLAEQKADLSRGSAVHHPSHGIGQVQSIRERNFDGANGAKFAQVYFKREALTLILPVQDAAEAVRSPINRKQARQILEHMESWHGNVSKQWKARANAHQEAMDRGDPFEYAEVFKNLHWLESEGALRNTDRAHLNRAMDFLVDELSFAFDRAPDRVRELILDAAGDP
jgi:CarD family transcriptional regulator